jgi:hypothetical protein
MKVQYLCLGGVWSGCSDRDSRNGFCVLEVGQVFVYREWREGKRYHGIAWRMSDSVWVFI